MAPVAGNPPKSDDPMFAAPCAKSSAFGRCRPAIIRSATIADKSDSTPARNAMMRADGSNSITLPKLKSGSAGHGRVLGRSPNREPMVSTGRSASATIADVTATAAISPGNFGATRRKTTISTMVPRPIRAEAAENVGRAAHSTSILLRNSAGTSATLSPKRSFSWLVAMITAMPIVKPFMTGSGTRRMRFPARKYPAISKIRPAMNVAMTRPS